MTFSATSTGLYALRRLMAARATQNTSRASPFVVFCSATFLRLLERFAFPYRNRTNVIYSRNVMCHTQILQKNPENSIVKGQIIWYLHSIRGIILKKIPHLVQYQGSKRNLAPKILNFFPNTFGRLYEPFAGSAAIT